MLLGSRFKFIVLHKGFNTIQEGVEVFQTTKAFYGFVLVVFLNQFGMLGNVQGRLVGIEGACLLTAVLYNLDEFKQGFLGAGAGVDLHQYFPHGDVLLSGQLTDFINRTIANAAFGKIDDPTQGFFILGIDGQAQVSNQVFDFLALVKRQTSKNLVGNIVTAQVFFHDPTLGIGAVQHGNVGVAEVIAVALF